MTHPIPAPRPSSDPLYRTRPGLPRRGPLIGPVCPPVALRHPQRTPSARFSPGCTHPSCRRIRAERLPRLGGHLAEYRDEHAFAASVQAQNRHLIIWYGEKTGSYWVASSTGLAEVPDAQTLTRLLTPEPPPASVPPSPFLRPYLNPTNPNLNPVLI